FGDNRWRVWYHHGVHVPASARSFRCRGSTAYPLDVLGSRSRATFVIDRGDLPQFLSQLRRCVPAVPPSGGIVVTSKPWSGPITPEGQLACDSPTGRDHLIVAWHSTPGGVVVDLDTEWN